MEQIDKLFQNGFYFSYGVDLSKNYLHNKQQKEYIWNKELMEPFIEYGFDDWNISIIRGFYGEIRYFNKIKFCIISRRIMAKNLGDNLFQKGLDCEGECGDLIETEH